ncbi:MAG: exodeoxyribonuclease VII small subunit [Gelidibacter sp.]|nr:exodeoxyribonuclease VII small subunit [Gelidibacter sp.]
MENEMKYTEAFEELQTIVSDMEDSKISIDDLDIKIKRASELLKICKDKLFKTETNVQKILNEIKDYSKD